jgi:hypothetical protein
MSDAIVEIRDYTFEAETFEAYKAWAEEMAVPWLKANLNVIDFWIDCGIEAEVSGTNPQVSPNGQPNITWIIRWDSIEDRRENFTKIMGSPEWKTIWAEHPNEKGYLQMNARFLKGTG